MLSVVLPGATVRVPELEMLQWGGPDFMQGFDNKKEVEHLREYIRERHDGRDTDAVR